MVAYSSRSAVTGPTPDPAPLSRVPDRVLARSSSTCPAGMKPPSKQWPLDSIIARSVSTEVGKRTSDAEQLLSRIEAFRLGVTASAVVVVSPTPATGAGAAEAGVARATT